MFDHPTASTVSQEEKICKSCHEIAGAARKAMNRQIATALVLCLGLLTFLLLIAPAHADDNRDYIVGPEDEIPEVAQFNGPACHGITNVEEYFAECVG
jgi:hypothetical protein